MTVKFPLFPDDMSFSPDNRTLMSNHQMLTNSPSHSDEEALVRSTTSYSQPGNYPDLQNINSSKIQQNQRPTYSSVKRPLGSKLEEVNTYERSHRRTAVEESKERAKRAAVQPRRPKGYVYPTDRVRPTLHSKIEEAPKINEERFREYQQRKELNTSSSSSSNSSSPSNKVNFDRLDTPTAQKKTNSSGDLFSRETTGDYFKQKRNRTYDRGF
ncbi:MAG: hypothetical protein ACK5LM_04380 [Lactovum sp.]